MAFEPVSFTSRPAQLVSRGWPVPASSSGGPRSGRTGCARRRGHHRAEAVLLQDAAAFATDGGGRVGAGAVQEPVHLVAIALDRDAAAGRHLRMHAHALAANGQRAAAAMQRVLVGPALDDHVAAAAIDVALLVLGPELERRAGRGGCGAGQRAGIGDDWLFCPAALTLGGSPPEGSW